MHSNARGDGLPDGRGGVCGTVGRWLVWIRRRLGRSGRGRKGIRWRWEGRRGMGIRIRGSIIRHGVSILRNHIITRQYVLPITLSAHKNIMGIEQPRLSDRQGRDSRRGFGRCNGLPKFHCQRRLRTCRLRPWIIRRLSVRRDVRAEDV